MDAYDKKTMASTLKLRFNGSRPILTRSAVISEIKEVLPVQELTAIYKCRDGREWYLTFSSESLVDEYGDRTVTGASSEVYCERIDKRTVRFRIHWYPFHMKCEPAQDYMEELGSQVVMEYDTDIRRRYYPEDRINNRQYDMYTEGVPRDLV
jgi:hypothetical protein